MRIIRNLVVISLFLALPAYSFAWGVLGHRIIGGIADFYLTGKAKTEIRKILGNESIALTSNWADFVRSDTSFRYLSPWHYINLDKGMSDEELHTLLLRDTATDLYTKMNFLVKELKKKKLSMEQKKMYLRLLIHLVGDAHEPMHTARKEDQGGNKVKVTWFTTPTNLHTVWDESLVNFQQLSYTEYINAINFTTLKQRKAWQQQPMSDWIIESYQDANLIYAGITEENQKLSYDYNFKYVGIVNDQLLKGGVRLAGVLNEIFR